MAHYQLLRGIQRKKRKAHSSEVEEFAKPPENTTTQQFFFYPKSLPFKTFAWKAGCQRVSEPAPAAALTCACSSTGSPAAPEAIRMDSHHGPTQTACWVPVPPAGIHSPASTEPPRRSKGFPPGVAQNKWTHVRNEARKSPRGSLIHAALCDF